MLPAVGEGMAVGSPTVRTAVMARGGETVLVVDDDASIRALIQRILRPLGYKVLEAKDGNEALRRITESGSDLRLLLSDVIMPGLGGRELAAKVAEEHPEIRIILMTGYPEDYEALAKIREDGIVLINKPILPSDLSAVVRELLDRPA